MREQCEARGIPTPLADAVCMSMALDPAKRFCECGSVGTGDARGMRSELPRAASCAACPNSGLGDGVDAPRAPEPRRAS